MIQAVETATDTRAAERSVPRRPIEILIPAYGAAEKLRGCLQSLAKHAPAYTVKVLDDATPDQSLRLACEEIETQLPALRYIRSEKNRGFVAICNWACGELRECGSDVLLLNSDTEVTAGFLEEMRSVLYLHEKHAAVSPRSNNATIFSLPFTGERLPPGESFELWLQIRHVLPRYQVMPTANGFCMLIKADVLDRFELFDEIYSPGYNEENDFICRINRCGYSAVSANWAFVFHHEGSSFGAKKELLEERNKEILQQRYPEYLRKVDDYVRLHADPVEHFVALYRPHRPRILYDLSHLEAYHCGTFEFGLNLLREIGHALPDDYELYVAINEPALSFFAPEIRGHRIYDPSAGDPIKFDLAFKPSQIFNWQDFQRMSRCAPRIGFSLQDIIAIRCEYLNSVKLQILVRRAAELSDRVFTISEFSRADFAAYYGVDVPMHVIHLGTNLSPLPGQFQNGEYVLLMGNAFAHKGIEDALRHLDGIWPLVVLGGKPKNTAIPAHVRFLPSGQLTRQRLRELLALARIVVYPSHYEGFGLPVLDALALGKHVIVLDTAVNRELDNITQDPNLHRIQSLRELRDTVDRMFATSPGPPSLPPRRWRSAGKEYVEAFRSMLSREIDVAKLRARWECMRILESVTAQISPNSK